MGKKFLLALVFLLVPIVSFAQLPAGGVVITSPDGLRQAEVGSGTPAPLIISCPDGTCSGGGGVGSTVDLIRLGGVILGGADVVDVPNTSFRVNCVVGCGSSSFADNSAFTFGTTTITNVGFVFDDVGPNAVTENRAATPRISSNRNIYTMLRDGLGNERGAAVSAANALKVDGSAVTQPVSQGNGGGVTPWDMNLLRVASTTLGTPLAPADAVGNPGVGVNTTGFNMVWSPVGAWYRVLSPNHGTVSSGVGHQTAAGMAEFDNVSPTACIEDAFCNLRISSNRNLFGTIRDAAGNERGVNVTAGNALVIDGSAVTQPISAATLPLPTNASTSALQTTGNTSLSSIDGKTPALVGGRVPVDGSGVTQPISAASLPLPLDAATETQQLAISGTYTPFFGGAVLPDKMVLIGGESTASGGGSGAALVMANSVPAVGVVGAVVRVADDSLGLPVSPIVGQVGVSAGSGVVDATTQRVALASNTTARVTGFSGQVPIDIVSSLGVDVALLSGTQVVGKVGIDQTTPGVTNHVDVSGTVAVTGPVDAQLQATDANGVLGDVSRTQNGQIYVFMAAPLQQLPLPSYRYGLPCRQQIGCGTPTQLGSGRVR